MQKSDPRTGRTTLDDPPSAPEDVAAMLRRAEAAVAEYAASYAEQIKPELEEMRRMVAAIGADAASAQPHIARLFDLAHNIKGHGASLGYPLMTSIGNLLCRLLRGRQSVGKVGLAAATAHLDAMDVVIGHRIKGDGGAQGRQLVAGLEAVVRKAEQAEAGS
jgi:hypothetical protein